MSYMLNLMSTVPGADAVTSNNQRRLQQELQGKGKRYAVTLSA